MEAAVTAEISLRKDAENGLAGALAAKRQTERFLSGILKV